MQVDIHCNHVLLGAGETVNWRWQSIHGMA